MDKFSDSGESALTAAVNGNDVWALEPGDKAIYASSDLGQSWSAAATTGLPAGAVWMARPDAEAGLAMVIAGHCASFKADCSTATMLYHSNDSGKTWAEVFP